MATEPTQPTPVAPKLTTQQKRFVEEYCVDWNGTQAAIRAGYSEKTARSIGSENLTKPNIRAAIDARLTQLSLSAGQTTKLISEIAETRLNEFLRVIQVPVRQRVEAYANVVLAQVKEEIALIEEKARPLKKKEAGAFRSMLTKLKKRQVELELEVMRHGFTAPVYVEGPMVLEDRIEIDMVKLAQAKEQGRIKSWKPTAFGVAIEFYDASASLRDMGRIHGIFEKDNSQAAATPVIHTKTEIINTGPPIARSEKDIDDV